MGSFNTTCFVSGQTIAPGNAVVMFPIVQSTSYEDINVIVGDKTTSFRSFSETTCYSNRFWSFLCPYISGTYDDCGRINIDDTPENIEHMGIFFQILSTYSAKTEEYDISTVYDKTKEYTFSNLCDIWEYVIDAEREQQIFSREAFHKTNLSPVSFCIMHRIAADYLISLSEHRVNSRHKSNKRESLILQNIITKKDRIDNDIKTFDCILDSSYILGGRERLYALHCDNSTTAMENVSRIIKEFDCTEESAIKLCEVFKSYFDTYYIYQSLNYLNISISPIVYCPQDYSNVIGNAFRDMVAHVGEIVDSYIEREEEYEEY